MQTCASSGGGPILVRQVVRAGARRKKGPAGCLARCPMSSSATPGSESSRPPCEGGEHLPTPERRSVSLSSSVQVTAEAMGIWGARQPINSSASQQKGQLPSHRTNTLSNRNIQEYFHKSLGKRIKIPVRFRGHLSWPS